MQKNRALKDCVNGPLIFKILGPMDAALTSDVAASRAAELSSNCYL